MKKLKIISMVMAILMLIVMVLPLTTTLATTDAKSLSYGVEGENVIEVDGRYFAKEGDTVTLFAYDYATGEKVALPENVGFNGNSKVVTNHDFDTPVPGEFTLDETSTKITVKSTDDWINYEVADLTTKEKVGNVDLTVNDEVYEQKALTLKARQYDYVLEGENVVNIDGDWYTLVGDTVTLVAYDKETGKQVAIPENIGFDYTGKIGDGLEGAEEEKTDIKIDETKTKITLNSKHEIGFNVRNLLNADDIDWVTMCAVSEAKYRELTVNEVTEPTTENIVNAIEDYKTTIVMMSEPTLVEKEVFVALKEAKNATLQINVANVTWEFNSETITKTDSHFTPAVQVSAEKFSHIKPNDITDGLFIEFAYDGELPGEADITIFVGADKYGEGQKELNLYYYNELTAKYEDMGTATYRNANLKLSLDHCSTYVVTQTKLETTENPTTPGDTEQEGQTTTENEKDETPKTGTTNLYVAVVAVVAVISLGALVTMKRVK